MFSRLAIAAALLAGAAAPALAFAGWAGWHGPFIGPVGGFLFLLAITALVVLVVSLIGAGRRRTSFATAATAAPRRPAFAILAERFARGDIDAREYEARRRVLAGESGPETAAPGAGSASAAQPPPTGEDAPKP